MNAKYVDNIGKTIKKELKTGTAAPAAPALKNEQSKYDLAMGYLNQYRDNQFKYDFNEDPVFQQAKDAYMKQGQLNAANVAAQSAQLTGGYGNSYGTVAAQSVMNQAADNVNAIIPDLQNAAYGRYQDEQNRNLNLANQYLTLHQQERDEAWEDEARERQRTEWAQNDEDRANDLAWQQEQQARQRVEWGYADEDRARNIAYTDEDRAWSRAMQAASAGDYSLLKDLGINVDTAEKAAMFSLGMQYAEIGDFSILDALGVDSSYLKKLQEYQLAAAGNSGRGGTGSRSYVTGGNKNDGDGDTPNFADMTDEEILQYLLTHESAVSDSAATVSGYGGVHDPNHSHDVSGNAARPGTPAYQNAVLDAFSMAGYSTDNVIYHDKATGVTTTYNPAGETLENGVHMMSANGDVIVVKMQSNGSLTVTDPKGNHKKVQYHYDSNGNVTGITVS